MTTKRLKLEDLEARYAGFCALRNGIDYRLPIGDAVSDLDGRTRVAAHE